MIDVVFRDSEKGAMRCGQRFTNNLSGANAIGMIGSETGQSTQEEYDAALSEARRRLERELSYGKPLGGRM